MCGFVVWIASESVDDSTLTLMRDMLTHRGPDNGSNWIESKKRIGFGHRRLSIIDTSHGADQPMHYAQGRLSIVFNGEIYNYIELRDELRALGHLFETQSDTEVLLAAYAQWGENCLPRLNGMFAFALWDADAQELLVARDRFGEKPLFVGKTKNGDVIYASEMKAILIHPQMQVAANQAAIDLYVRSTWYEDAEMTFFQDIERIPPSHALVIDVNGNEKRRWRYWTPNYEREIQISDAEAERRFSQLLARSVNMRLRADVPVGSSLSGGLDSSAIVGLLAAERSKRPFSQNTFSACFDTDPTISETPFIDAVVDYTHVNSFRVNPDPAKLMQESERLHWHQEEPFLSASIYLQWCVARLAKENNTTVMLDGQGADELLAGYQFWYQQYQLDMLDKRNYYSLIADTWRFTRRLKKSSSLYADSARRFNARSAYGWRELLRKWRSRPGLWGYPYESGVPALTRGMRLKRILAEALQYNSLPMLLRYADRNAMAFSRESRMPFLDYDIVDFVIGLPSRQLIRKGWQKWILRRITEGFIPDSVRWRADKVGYAAPLDIWLRGAMKDWAQQRVFAPELDAIKGYDRNTMRKLWDEHQSGNANHSWALWRWISLTEWFALLDKGYWKRPFADSVSRPEIIP